jgi:hypothetical protein
MGNGTDSGMRREEGDGMVWRKDSITAAIVDVMADSGMIAFRGLKGKTHTLRVDRRVDLKEIAVGEHVALTFYWPWAIELRALHERDRDSPFVVEKTVDAPGNLEPRGGALRRLRAVVTVCGVDEADDPVGINDSRGRSFVLKVAEPYNLDSLRRGEKRVVVFVEGIVIEIAAG